jgi:uncharacterized pyridoxamine 5'-phosphate oxidase family protein/Pyruvate/2-oxoacid:ferredoxin oxidoreductase delta subunit
MDVKTCIQKLRLIATVSMATVGEDGSPHIRTISVMHIENESIYFLTARGKSFYHELQQSKKVAVLGLSRFNEMIRLNGEPELLPKDEQGKWLSLILAENPYLKNVYPGDTIEALEVFCIRNGGIEYFNFGVHPIIRESYVIGNFILGKEVYYITNKCIGCGTCIQHCPQGSIISGTPYQIVQKNCLSCGLCQEKCPISIIEYGNKPIYE